MSDYYSIPTTLGAAKLAAAANNNQALTLSHMAFGDANGVPYLPITRVNTTQLVNERYRIAVQFVVQDTANPNVYIIKARIPANIGGFDVSELAIFDTTGDMIYLANYPRTFKPQITQGAGGELTIKLHVMTSHSNNISIILDPHVITLTQGEGDKRYALKTELDSEAITRENGDLALAVALAAEITNREAGDTAEAIIRENADNGLSQAILNEATARENGDLALAIALAAEITNRENSFNNVFSQLSHSFFVFHGYNKNQDYLNTLKIKAHTDVLIFASAGGAGGGGQGGINGSFNAGTDGADTKIVISKETLTGSITSPTNSPSKFTSTLLEGGKRGTGGYRFNGNTGNHQSGESGDDGDYVVYLVNDSISSEMRSVLSVILESNPNPAQGAANDANASPVTQFKRYKFNYVSTDNAYLAFQESGKGGNGKYTSGGNLAGNSGHGGHGAKVLLHIKNMGTTDMYLSFRVGAKGLGGAGDYANGDDGTDGSILILGAIPV